MAARFLKKRNGSIFLNVNLHLVEEEALNAGSLTFAVLIFCIILFDKCKKYFQVWIKLHLLQALLMHSSEQWCYASQNNNSTHFWRKLLIYSLLFYYFIEKFIWIFDCTFFLILIFLFMCFWKVFSIVLISLAILLFLFIMDPPL